MEFFSTLSLWQALGVFALAAAAVWAAGSRLSGLVSDLADRLEMNQGFAGMLLLGGITSLPEIATAGSAALTGSPDLAMNDLFGTSSVNLVLLVIADLFVARAALASMVATSTALIQAVLGMLLMTGAAVVALVGEREIAGLGLGYGSVLLTGACAFSLWLTSRYERNPGWTSTRDQHLSKQNPELQSSSAEDGEVESTRSLALKTVLAAAVILVAGFFLAQSGGAVAKTSGVGTGMTGLVLVGFSTSLPELSSILAAIKLRRFDLAIGDVLGTNIFNVAVLFVVDLAYREGPALERAGTFEAVAALLAVTLTGTFLLGLIARGRRMILRLGYAAWASLLLYAGGLVVLWSLKGSE